MRSLNQSPSLLHGLRRWWGERVPRAGFGTTARQFATVMWEFLRDSTPERRRQRYGDVDFDWEYRVDTTSATVAWRDRLLGVFHSPYQPTEPALFREMIEALGIDYRRYTFVDLGSGKGRTLLMASEYPFHKIVGVELLPHLHRVAEDNVKKFLSGKKISCEIETICGDAAVFPLQPEPLVLYLFNPLPEAGLETVVANLERSLADVPREALVVYHNPLLEHVLARSCSLRKVRGTAQYALYASEPTRAMAVSN